MTAAALVACQGTPVVSHKTATVTPTPKPAASASVAAPASLAPRVLLKRPSTAVTELKGTIQMDPGYVVSVRQGQVLANNGSNILALSNGGVLSNNGAGLISDKGGGIISDHGAGVIAEGNQVAPAFHVLAADPTDLLPAAGALIHLTSLKTGKPLAIGVDTDGKPVTGIYSNAVGGFSLYIDAAEAGNVLVEATVPGATDERLQYGLLVAASGSAAMDDDTDLVSRFLRSVFVTRMIPILVEPGGGDFDAALASSLNDQNPAVRDLLRSIVADVSAAAVKANVPRDAKNPAVQALAHRMVDTLIASLGPPGDIKITKLMAPKWTGAESGALDGIAVALKALRRAAQLKLADEPTFFKDHTFYFEDGDGKPSPGKVDVVKASDLGAYMVKEFLSKNQAHGIDNCNFIFRDLGAPVGLDGIQHSTRVEAATYAVLGAIALSLTPDGAARGPVLDTLDAYAREQGWLNERNFSL
ncbi:MAG: hypothetical protein JWM80_1798 [Cyanobacteria bacterium RYN_339]|nr:hypothetical protein [Cyanobacteria bacterium RYN_339]